MAEKSGSRDAHFPAIEKKYGQPMRYWFDQMEQIADRKYPEQIAYLKENFGFSQTHANALVMFSRGSTTSKRFTTLDQFLKTCDPAQKKTVKAIFETIKKSHPKLELVIAWNKPMLKAGDAYVFGVAVASKHILLAPFDATILAKMTSELADYTVLKKTVRVPSDWDVDAKLLKTMVTLAVTNAKKA